MRYLLFAFWWLYYYTIGQAIFYVQYRIAKRKGDQAWREFLRKYTV